MPKELGFVVYLLTPTSNHNISIVLLIGKTLYIFWLLHQTTTVVSRIYPDYSCISFDSYIKPQLFPVVQVFSFVVYLLTPTSNHNQSLLFPWHCLLYIFWLLHQTTTWPSAFLQTKGCISFDSYIKPQLTALAAQLGYSCISFDSYIKPQPNRGEFEWHNVVYLLTPTSNHNSLIGKITVLRLYIFWLLHQTTTWRSLAM